MWKFIAIFCALVSSFSAQASNPLDMSHIEKGFDKLYELPTLTAPGEKIIYRNIVASFVYDYYYGVNFQLYTIKRWTSIYYIAVEDANPSHLNREGTVYVVDANRPGIIHRFIKDFNANKGTVMIADSKKHGSVYSIFRTNLFKNLEAIKIAAGPSEFIFRKAVEVQAELNNILPELPSE